jgi:hypothetical protein
MTHIIRIGRDVPSVLGSAAVFAICMTTAFAVPLSLISIGLSGA